MQSGSYFSIITLTIADGQHTSAGSMKHCIYTAPVHEGCDRSRSQNLLARNPALFISDTPKQHEVNNLLNNQDISIFENKGAY